MTDHPPRNEQESLASRILATNPELFVAILRLRNGKKEPSPARKRKKEVARYMPKLHSVYVENGYTRAETWRDDEELSRIAKGLSQYTMTAQEHERLAARDKLRKHLLSRVKE